jgi:hypothetical protein
MKNLITSNEINLLFDWFEKHFPDFERTRGDNLQARWYQCLSPMTKNDLRRGCMKTLILRDEAGPKMTIPPSLEMFTAMCMTT